MNALFTGIGGSRYTSATISVARCPDVKSRNEDYKLTIFKNGLLLLRLDMK